MTAYFLHNNLFKYYWLTFVPSTLLATLKIFKHLCQQAQLLDSMPFSFTPCQITPQLCKMKLKHRKMPSMSEISDKLEDHYRGQ